MILCMKQLTYAQVRFPERVSESWLPLVRAIYAATHTCAKQNKVVNSVQL